MSDERMSPSPPLPPLNEGKDDDDQPPPRRFFGGGSTQTPKPPIKAGELMSPRLTKKKSLSFVNMPTSVDESTATDPYIVHAVKIIEQVVSSPPLQMNLR